PPGHAGAVRDGIPQPADDRGAGGGAGGTSDQQTVPDGGSGAGDTRGARAGARSTELTPGKPTAGNLRRGAPRQTARPLRCRNVALASGQPILGDSVPPRPSVGCLGGWPTAYRRNRNAWLAVPSRPLRILYLCHGHPAFHSG